MLYSSCYTIWIFKNRQQWWDERMRGRNEIWPKKLACISNNNNNGKGNVVFPKFKREEKRMWCCFHPRLAPSLSQFSLPQFNILKIRCYLVDVVVVVVSAELLLLYTTPSYTTTTLSSPLIAFLLRSTSLKFHSWIRIYSKWDARECVMMRMDGHESGGDEAGWRVEWQRYPIAHTCTRPSINRERHVHAHVWGAGEAKTSFFFSLSHSSRHGDLVEKMLPSSSSCCSLSRKRKDAFNEAHPSIHYHLVSSR